MRGAGLSRDREIGRGKVERSERFVELVSRVSAFVSFIYFQGMAFKI